MPARTTRRLSASVGFATLVTYFVVAYVGPAIGYALFPEEILARAFFNIKPANLYTVALAPAVFGLFWYLHRQGFRLRQGSRTTMPSRFLSNLFVWYERFRLPIGLISLVLAFFYNQQGLNNVRYREIGISESGSVLLFVVVALNTLISVDLFRGLFILQPEQRTRQRVESFVLALAYLLSANSVFGVFIGLCVMVSVAAPTFFRRLLFASAAPSPLVRVRRLATLASLTAAIFMVAWLTGEGIKASSSTRVDNDILSSAGSTASDLVSNESWYKNYFFALLERSSIYYYSLRYTTNDLSEVEYFAGGHPIMLPINNLLFRADVLMGGRMRLTKPVVPSVAGLNYLLLIDNPKRFPRAGSTPGLVAAFCYSVPFPLNILACAVYMAWFARLLDVLLWRRGTNTVTLLGLMMLYMFSEPFLQSPFDLLVIFDGATLFAVLIWVLYRFEAPQYQAHRQALREQAQTGGVRPTMTGLRPAPVLGSAAYAPGLSRVIGRGR